LKQPVTREDFDQSIGKLVGKTVSTVQAMLKTAGVAAEAVILTDSWRLTDNHQFITIHPVSYSASADRGY
jgi:hypothetical protein